MYEIPKCSWYINWKLSKYTSIKYGQRVHKSVGTAKTSLDTLIQEHDRTNQQLLAFIEQKRNWNWRDLFLKMTTGYEYQEHQEKKPKQVPSGGQILNKTQGKYCLADLLSPKLSYSLQSSEGLGFGGFFLPGISQSNFVIKWNSRMMVH